MNTQDRIKQSAIENFGKYGYKGASLSKIADDVGIKKPSLYAHFENKLDLFESCMDYARNEFMAEVESFVIAGNDTKAMKVMYDLLMMFSDENSTFIDGNKFYLRFAYMPPEELGENKIRFSNDFIDSLSLILDDTVIRLIAEEGTTGIERKEIMEAYLCVFDGLMIELLFGEYHTYKKRLEAVWKIFERGVEKWHG